MSHKNGFQVTIENKIESIKIFYYLFNFIIIFWYTIGKDDFDVLNSNKLIKKITRKLPNPTQEGNVFIGLWAIMILINFETPSISHII